MHVQLDGLDLQLNVNAIQPLEDGLLVKSPALTVSLPEIPVRYLYAGWQSWSLTSWVKLDRPILPMRPNILHPMQTDPLYARESRPNGSWYGAVEFADGRKFFLGALGLESHVLLDGKSLTGFYEKGEGDWFLASGDESKFMSRYAEFLGVRLGHARTRSVPRIWCSWYSLYVEINESWLQKILEDVGQIDSPQCMPFDVFQVDDGWQVGIGNWEPNTKFPSGMKNLAARIIDSGRKAGLWLAPLLIVPSSEIYRQHRDWLLHDENNRLVRAGFNWGEPLFALDTTNPAVLDWLVNLMHKVRSWGYEYVKLDFLYAGALPGKRFVDLPRESAYTHGLKTIRQALGSAYLLACGAPILPSIGLCDGLRIGPDVSGNFASPLEDNLLMNYTTPGLRNGIRTSFNRLWLQPLVNIDPDVVYFGTRLNDLSKEHKSIQKDLAKLCNLKSTSDIPSWLSEGEWNDLQTFLASQSEILKTGKTSFQIDGHAVDFGKYINLPNSPRIFTNILGVLIGRLACIPTVLKAFDKLINIQRKNSLKDRPV